MKEKNSKFRAGWLAGWLARWHRYAIAGVYKYYCTYLNNLKRRSFYKTENNQGLHRYHIIPPSVGMTPLPPPSQPDRHPPPDTDTPLTQWIHMSSFVFFTAGPARRKHKSTPTENVSWFGDATTSPRTFSRGTLAKVPLFMDLLSPTPVVFTTRTRGLWLGVRPACQIWQSFRVA